jgi:hypothetical protein
MDFKFLFSIVGVMVGSVGFLPYFRDIFRKKTQPHAYTWFILVITQGIGTIAILHGGGEIGALWLAINTLLAFFVLILSFRYGTKNITKTDTIVLIAALCAIVIWWRLNNPYLATLMASAIDFAAAIPTIRKSFYEPRSETISLWICFTIANFLSIVALKDYNFLTLFYLVTISIGNILIVLTCLVRRQKIFLNLLH